MSIFLSAALPALLTIFYILYIDRAQVEPTRLIVKSFVYGMLCSIPAMVLESLLAPYLDYTSAGSAANAAIVEEGVKYLALWLLLKKNDFFDEHIDGIVYAACLGVGFSFIENIGYFIVYEDSVNLRILTPAHFILGIFMGFFIASAHFSEGAMKRLYLIAALIVPAFVHWLWDYICFDSQYNSLLLIVGLVFYIVIIILAFKAIKRQQSLDDIDRTNARKKEIELIRQEAVEEYLEAVDKDMVEKNLDQMQ